MAAVAPARSRRRGHTQVIWKFMSKGDRFHQRSMNDRVKSLRNGSSPIITSKINEELMAFLMPIR